MYQSVLTFWFNELTPEMWWKKDVSLDDQIRDRFTPLHEQAVKGELFHWRQCPQGALAEVIVLDQFSRNIFRDTLKAFAQDPQALTLAQFAIEKGFHKQLTKSEQVFLYLPFMHSESRLIHAAAMDLYSELGEQVNLDFEMQHKAIIERFGRYPHRNAILGRQSTAEELEFLKLPNSAF
ncbi:DUF924 domain-containing protein [Vibrio fluvialis]|uniref:Putative transmembrane protein n=1 Tax=Vibrio fluvialis PG41 TaxID=1336752 RepID=S7I7Y6_VIBFL|nr:DUF924 family protein [Vibrio fluvialis]TNF15584.1 MAG: DUF924 domain-containing protein [Vibrionaceae bacterium]HDM8033432.1 DUF924 domain-containing protein [Vibrio fluvialis clinical-1]EKO3391486.1 DUF924 domain-containing protein [Vibrio fluvialis]EKO3416236.1 DUF924 domain-containing protein [Vibrio fluvialis]EKO3420443.1 DUF924 domain-containing protein [Vibrio fluvialis]